MATTWVGTWKLCLTSIDDFDKIVLEYDMKMQMNQHFFIELSLLWCASFIKISHFRKKKKGLLTYLPGTLSTVASL